MIGKIYQYCVIRSRLLSIGSATIDEMRTSDFFSSLLDIGACFAMKPGRSKLSLILYAILKFGKELWEPEKT
jgi:hypothetical protein